MQAENRIGLDRSVRLARCVNRVRKLVRNKRSDRCINREAGGQILREEIYLGVSVDSRGSFMSIEVRVSTSLNPYGLV